MWKKKKKSVTTAGGAPPRRWLVLTKVRVEEEEPCIKVLPIARSHSIYIFYFFLLSHEHVSNDYLREAEFSLTGRHVST